MTGLGIYLTILVLFLAIMMFIRVRFEVDYTRRNKDDQLTVELTALWKIVRYKTEIPVIHFEKYLLDPMIKIETEIETVVSHPIEEKGLIVKIPILKVLRNLPNFISSGLNYMKRYKSILYGLLKTIRCHELKMSTTVGLTDPADTGIVVGVLWSVMGFLYRVFRSNVGRMKKDPELLVAPCFSEHCLRLDFYCIFDLRIGNIIIAGLKFVKLRLIP